MEKSWMLEPRSSHSFMESTKDKLSRSSNSMKNIIGDQGGETLQLNKKYRVSWPSSIGEQEEQTLVNKKDKLSRPRNSMKSIICEQGVETPQLKKRHKVSWSSKQGEQTPQLTKKYTFSRNDSMEDMVDELEEVASSPCQVPLASQWIDHEAGSSNKKKRGPTKSLKTHGLRYEDRLVVKLNIHGQPIGRYRATLSTYLGTLARNAHIAPLIYTSWKGLKENWDDMWQTVITKFDVEERAKKWVLQTICSSWRSHKCRLKKKYFKPNMPDEYNLKNRPSIVPLEQWKILIQYWKSDSAMTRSKKNKISRAKLTSMHTTGSKTFAEIRHEETIKNPDGREPSRVEMYLMTHKPKNRSSMNEGTRRIVSQLEDVIALHPKESEQSTAQDDIFSQILGKDRPGHVRTYGKGVVPSDLWGTRSALETQKLIDEVRRNAEIEIQIMQEKMQEKIKEEVEAMKLELLGGFKIVLAELQKSFPGVTIPDLSSIFIPNENKGEAVVINYSTLAQR